MIISKGIKLFSETKSFSDEKKPLIFNISESHAQKVLTRSDGYYVGNAGKDGGSNRDDECNPDSSPSHNRYPS